MNGKMMKENVIIKSYQNGITLLLREEAPFSELLEEIAYKFHESGKFFGSSKMALSLEGRKLTEKEERSVLQAIQQNCDVNIVCLVGHDDTTNQMFAHAVEEITQQRQQTESEGQFYKGTLKNHQVLETESSIVVLGDVYPGCAIISSRNIIVLGGLYGEAYAGGNGGQEHYVVALEMEPEKIKIGDFKYSTKEKGNKWSIKPKVRPKIAYVKNGRIILEPLTKELLGMF